MSVADDKSRRLSKQESVMKKNIIASLCIIVILPFLFSSGLERDIVISGKVQNAKSPHISINKQSVSLNSAGKFQYSVNLKKPAYIEVDFGKQVFLYLSPGDSLNLEIDADAELKSIKLSGDRQEINRLLIEMTHESEKVTGYFNKNFRNIINLDEKEYVNKMNSLWQPFKEQFEVFIEKHEITDEYFIKTQSAMMLYSWADILMRYPGWRRQVSGDTNYNPPENYYDFIDGLDLNDPELIDLSEYSTFLKRYLDYKSEEALKKSSELKNRNYKSFRAKMQVALNTFTAPSIRSEMMYPFMKSLMGEYYHKGIDDLIQAFKQNCTNQDYIDEIEKLYRQDKAIRDKCIVKVYKTIDDVTLDVFLYSPSDIKKGEKRPALAFFHGGGWESGKPEWGQMQCEHFSSLGLVALSFEYRLTTQHDATPLEGIADAKSAIRWIRANAGELGVDPGRIVASGFSAGGHLALCTAMIDKFDEPHEDHSISSAAEAFMLWVTPAKVFDDGWFKQILRNKAKVKECDPDAHVRPGLPPSIIFQGTADDQVPFWSVKEFVEKMTAAGNRCELHIYEGQTHLNWGENTRNVLQKMDKFLESIGYLDF